MAAEYITLTTPTKTHHVFMNIKETFELMETLTKIAIQEVLLGSQRVIADCISALRKARRRKPYLVMEESSSSNMSSSFAMFSLTTMRPLGVRAAVARLKKETKSSERMKSDAP